jgi:hypothetical protein
VVCLLLQRSALGVVADASLDDLERDKVLNVGAKFGAIFGRGGGGILGIFTAALQRSGCLISAGPDRACAMRLLFQNIFCCAAA